MDDVEREREITEIANHIMETRKSLSMLESRKDELDQEREVSILRSMVGKCFQDDAYDNTVDKNFFKVMSIANTGDHGAVKVWILRIVLPFGNAGEMEVSFDSMELMMKNGKKISYDKVASKKYFEYHVKSIIKQVAERGIIVDIDRCIANGIGFKLTNEK